MIKEMIKKISEGKDLTKDEAEKVTDEIMSGEATTAQTAAFLTALSLKKETAGEIAGAAASMKKHALALEHDMDVLEIVGTGGDASGSFNISTTASFIVAAAGVKVAKHGNKAASSKSGAADVLEELGVNINLTPQQSRRLLEKTGFCFLFARNYHPAMKNVASVRSEIGIRTIFNILGPLTNPAGAKTQLLGVYSERLLEPMSEALMSLGVEKGMSVYGTDGMDEISISAPTIVCEFADGRMKKYSIKPEDFGYNTCDKDRIRGGNPKENARISLDIFEGKDRGPKRQMVCMNAGAALYIAGRTDTLESGIRMAEEMIDSGRAFAALEAVRNFTLKKDLD